MRPKLFFILIFAFIFYYSNAQNNLQGIVLDKKTNMPLAFATIGAVNFLYGTYSDSLGNFYLNYKNTNDSLKISYLGYKSFYTCVSDLQKDSIVFLEPSPLRLEEVVASPNRSKMKSYELGYFSKKGYKFLRPPNQYTYATFIAHPNDGKEKILESVKFKYLLEEVNSPLRLRILDVAEGGRPGEDILLHNVIFKDYKKHGKQIAIVDISEYNLTMPEKGLFIALEILEPGNVSTKDQDNNKGPALDIIRHATESNSRWVNVYNHPDWIEMESELPFQFTFAIGLTVKSYVE